MDNCFPGESSIKNLLLLSVAHGILYRNPAECKRRGSEVASALGTARRPCSRRLSTHLEWKDCGEESGFDTSVKMPIGAPANCNCESLLCCDLSQIKSNNSSTATTTSLSPKLPPSSLPAVSSR